MDRYQTQNDENSELNQSGWIRRRSSILTEFELSRKNDHQVQVADEASEAGKSNESELWKKSGVTHVRDGLNLEASLPPTVVPPLKTQVHFDLPPKKESPFVNHFGGIILTLIASMLSSTILILVKVLHKLGIGAPETVCFAYSGVFLPSIPFMIYNQCVVMRGRRRIQQTNHKLHSPRKSVVDSIWPLTIPERRNNFIGLVIQSIFGAVAILGRYFSLKFISVGDTVVISIGSPVIVTIVAHFLLGEKTGVIPILMALLALVGVGIISRPPILTGEDTFDTQTLIGTTFAFASMACIAMQTIIVRKIRGVDFSLQLMVTGGVGVGVAVGVALIQHGTFHGPTNWIEATMAGVIASFGFVVMSCMVLALKIETAGVVSLVRTCDVFFGFILQFIFFGLAPDIYSAIGGFIICFGVVATGFRKYLESVPIGRKRVGFFKFAAVCCCMETDKSAQMYKTEFSDSTTIEL